MELLIEHIRRQRIDLGMTQQVAADRAGLKQPTWSDIETGKQPAGFSHLEKMAAAVGQRIEWRLVPVEAGEDK